MHIHGGCWGSCVIGDMVGGLFSQSEERVSKTALFWEVLYRLKGLVSFSTWTQLWKESVGSLSLFLCSLLLSTAVKRVTTGSLTLGKEKLSRHEGSL